MSALKLNEAQLDRFSEIIGNLGLILFASLVLQGLIDVNLDMIKIYMGLVLSVGCVILSLSIIKEV